MALTVLSYGGGQDSTTILLKIIHEPEFRKQYVKDDLLVVMANTGNEHDETYEYVSMIEEVCIANEIDFFLLDNGAR